MSEAQRMTPGDPEPGDPGRTPRILFFVHSLSAGGAERVVATLADSWAERGWAVTIVTNAGRERDFYAVNPSVERVSLGLDIGSSGLLSAISNNLRRVRMLVRVLRAHRPDVAVSFMTTSNCLLAVAGGLTRTPTIGSERIHPPALPPGRAWERLRQFTYPYLSTLVVQTRETEAWVKRNLRGTRVEVIPNPVRFPLVDQEPRLEPREVISDPASEHILLAVGRLEEQKGFDRLIPAFASVADKHLEWTLVILGEGRQRQPLEGQVRQAGLESRILLPGAVGNMDQWLRSASAYVLSSRFEGFPNTLLEAMAYGVPSVAMDCSAGPRDIISDGQDGLLVKNNGVENLSHALDRIMSNADLRRRLAEGAVTVRARFSVTHVTQEWERLFRRV